MKVKLNESFANPKATNPKDLVSIVLGWYDFNTDYIDDGGQRRTAETKNKNTVEWFGEHPIELKKEAFKLMIARIHSSDKARVQNVFGKVINEVSHNKELKEMRNIKETIKSIIKEESEYETFFRKALDKAGKGIADMDDAEKKAFFNKIDTAWTGKGEKNEGNTFGAERAKAIAKGDDSFKVDGKSFKVTGVDAEDKENAEKFSNESIVNEDVNFRDGKYRFYSKDGIGYLTYDGKEIADGDYDYEGGNAYFMNHSSFKRGQTAFDTGKDVIAYFKKNNITNESTTSSAPGEWVAYLSMLKGKKLLKTFNTARGAKQFLSKNVDKLLYGASVESVGIMTKKEWDEREAKYAVEGVNEGKKVFKVNPPIGKAKYSISSHNGTSTHNDGSDFYDIKIFKSKVDLEKGIKDYKSKGFVEEGVNEASEPLKLKGIKINKTNDITFILEISFLMGEKVVISYLSTGTQMDAQKLKSKLEKAFSAGKVLSPSAIGYYAYNESVINEEKYTVIDPRGNQMGASDKGQAVAIAKKKGGENAGFFVVSNKNALKARRALEKFKGDFKNPKLKDMMADLFYEDVKIEGNTYGANRARAIAKGEKTFKVGGDVIKVTGVDAEDKENAEKFTNENELPKATVPASVKAKLDMAIDKIKDTKLSYNQKLNVVGSVMDSLGIDKSEFGKMASKLKGTMEGVNEEKFQPNFAKKIEAIIEKELGVGKLLVNGPRTGRVQNREDYYFSIPNPTHKIVVSKTSFGGMYEDFYYVALTNYQGISKEETEVKQITDENTVLKIVSTIAKKYKNKLTYSAMGETKTVNEAISDRDLPKWLFDDPIDFEDWYEGGMELEKGKLAPLSSTDEKKLFALVGMWQDAEGDYQYGRGDLGTGKTTGARSASYSAQDLIKKFLTQKGKVVNELVNEKKGDDVDISDFLGKGRQPTRSYKLIAKDGKYTLEHDYRSDSIRLLYNGKQISNGWYNYTTGVGIDMEHPSWRVKNNYEKNFKTEKDIFNYFKSNKITTENVVKESVNENFSADDIENIKKAVEGADSFMGIGVELKRAGFRYGFSTEPLPLYMIKKGTKTFVLINKRYAESPDFVIGSTAGGMLESNSVNENFSIKRGYNTFTDYEKNAKVGDTILKYDKRGGMIKTFVKGSELHKDAQRYLSKVHSIAGGKVNLSLFGKQGYASVPDYEKNEVGVLVLETKITEQLVPVDKKAVDAFFDKKDFEGKNLNSDGMVLKTVGVGSQEMFAHTPNGVKFVGKVTGKYAQSLLQYVNKNFKGDLTEIIKSYKAGDGEQVAKIYSGHLKGDERYSHALTVVDVLNANGLVTKAVAKQMEQELANSLARLRKSKSENVNEGNAFGMAVSAAKKEGLKEFEFNGKTYKVKKGSYEKNEAAKKLAEKENGNVVENTHVVVSMASNGYGTLMSGAVDMKEAEKLKKGTTVPRGEDLQVITVVDAKKMKGKLLGAKALK